VTAADDPTFIAQATGADRVERGQRIQSLWSGYGEIYRARLQGARARSVVVKSVTPPLRDVSLDTPQARSHERKCASYDVELAWYRDYAARCDDGCRVPTSFGAIATEGRWLFVLEDLDDAGFARRCRGEPRAADVDLCLSWLAAFHARFLGTRPVGLWQTGTYWHLATRPDELAALDDPALRAAAPLIDRRLRAARYQTLVHGDAKLANFCFGDGAVAAVDFQYVGGGCAMSDVSYFLGSCFRDGSDPDEQRHLDTYFAHLRRALSSRAFDVDAIEAEWRALYRFAEADFYRFFAGWAKAHWAHDSHGQRVVREVMTKIGYD
jgi:hypothetical protein